MTRAEGPESHAIHGQIAVVTLVALTGLLAAISGFAFDGRIMARLAAGGVGWHEAWPVQAFALLGKTEPQIWLLLVWFCAGHRRERPVLAALCTILLLALIVPTLKIATHRVRPVDNPEIVGYDPTRRGDNVWYAAGSFPSGDTATVCGIAVSLGCSAASPWLAVLLAVGAGVGALRVVSFAHYPSDVLAGAALGMSCAWLVLRMMQRRRLPDWIAGPVSRRVAAVGLIIVPLPILIARHHQRAWLFLGVYVLPLVALYLLRKTTARLTRRAKDS